MLSLAFALLLNATVSVRVLESAKPVSLTVEATTIRCGDTTLKSPTEVSVSVHDVKTAGDVHCDSLEASGEVKLRNADITRSLRGSVRIVLEAGALKIINTLDVEDYVASVVTQTLGADAPAAALEAQAIVSRTFVLTQLKRHAQAGYGVCDVSHCQLYGGASLESPAARAAVEMTKGKVLLIGGMSLKPAHFHQACGGSTSRAADVLETDAAGAIASDVLKSGKAACADVQDFDWSWTVERHELANALGLLPKGDAFETLRRDSGGRIIEVRTFGQRMSAAAFMAKVNRVFGDRALRSMRAKSSESKNEVRFEGQGAGHGVGLCQQGAIALARAGKTAGEILLRYFPDSRLGQLE